MPDTLQKALRTRLLRSPHLRTLLEDLHLLTRLDTHILDPLGNTLLTHPRRETRPLCRALHAHPPTRAACTRLRLQHLAAPPPPESPPCCAAGLRQIHHPLRINDQPLGTLLLAGYRDPDHGPAETQHAWSRAAAAGSPLPWTDWHTHWLHAPAYSPRQIQAIQHWINLALHDLHRHLQDPNPFLTPDHAIPATIHHICTLIRDRHPHPVKLNDLAAELNLSPEHLSRLFHQTTGLRFKDYLAEVRLNHACERLLHSNDRIADIALAVGYPTLSRFNRIFRDFTGMTPSEYRKRKKPFFRTSEKGS